MDGIENYKEKEILVSKNKNPINVYWSTETLGEPDIDWTFLYPKPNTVFSELIKERQDVKDTESYFFCPAVSSKFKKTLIFKNSVNSFYEFGKNEEDFYIKETPDTFIHAQYVRKPSIINKPTFAFNLCYSFFADDSLDVSFTPPYFHKPQYLQSGSIIPGEFNVGKWFRPYICEIQMWEETGNFSLNAGEPLFYAEFKTDRPINFYRFNYSDSLVKYQTANIRSSSFFGPFQTLSKRYENFKQVGYKEKILTEIKKNLVDEEPYRF